MEECNMLTKSTATRNASVAKKAYQRRRKSEIGPSFGPLKFSFDGLGTTTLTSQIHLLCFKSITFQAPISDLPFLTSSEISRHPATHSKLRIPLSFRMS